MNNEQMENGYMDEEMEKRVVDEKKGKRLVDEEMLKTVEEKRREYRKASERFEAVTSFLSRYSSGDSALNDDLKYLFRVCGGQPIQDVIYSTLIYEIDIRDWERLSPEDRDELLMNKGAELYHYQRKLNKCIGRTFYVSSIKDSTLLWHIKDEIVYRFPFMKADFDRMEEKGGIDCFPDGTFNKYENIYLVNYESDPYTNFEDSSHLIHEMQKHFREHRIKNDHYIRDEKTFWLAVTHKRTKGPSTLITKQMFDSYGRRLYPTKDDLFVFAIAVRLSYVEFTKLVECAVEDCGDSARYAYNTANIRDALILSVIRDINGWYRQAMDEEIRVSKDRLTPAAVRRKSYLPSEVLFRVDKLLWENLCRGEGGTRPPLERLLYHSFLLDRGDRLYAEEYRRWAGQKGAGTIIDFQNEVKAKMREARMNTIRITTDPEGEQ